MRAVDTNVLVRLMIRDDVRQVAVAEAYVEQGACVSVLALAEAVWVVGAVHKRNATEIAAAVEMILNLERLAVQDADVVAAALSLFRKRPALGFSDCLVLETARQAGHLPLGTFDRRLGKVDGTHQL
jgi:predicted nucleic-acid-binding protein